MSLTNSTVSGNSGSAVYNSILSSSGVSNSTISDNGGGTVQSFGYNLSSDDGTGYLNGPGNQINTDPLLGPLEDNGGATFTHELLSGSPAISAGDPNFVPPPYYDQRGLGFDRVRGNRIDVGSFENQWPPRPTPTPRPRPTPLPRP